MIESCIISALLFQEPAHTPRERHPSVRLRLRVSDRVEWNELVLAANNKHPNAALSGRTTDGWTLAACSIACAAKVTLS
jgi:hypothetical protein